MREIRLGRDPVPRKGILYMVVVRGIFGRYIFSSEWVLSIQGTVFGTGVSRIKSSRCKCIFFFVPHWHVESGIAWPLSRAVECILASSPPLSLPSPRDPPQLQRHGSASPGDLCLLLMGLVTPLPLALPPIGRSDERRCSKGCHISEDGALWGHFAPPSFQVLLPSLRTKDPYEEGESHRGFYYSNASSYM